MRDTETAYVGIGANLGDPVGAVNQAMEDLGGLPGTRVIVRSPLYRTAPVDAGGGDFINAVVELSTRLAPLELLAALQGVEDAAGRERPFRNAPRTLDLDLLVYGSTQMDTQRLTLPHPRMLQRAFVLVPLHEIAPGLVTRAQLDAVADQRIEGI